jgi:ATP-dependent Clp protease, protease subunit
MVLPSSRILIHQPSGGFQGQTTDIEIHARAALELRKRVDDIYARHTGRAADELHADMERDRFFTPQQAVEYGLADEVIKRHQLRREPTGFRPG